MKKTPKKQFHFGIYGVINHNKQLLVVNKSRGPYKGLFDLPGGRAEQGENTEETLQREILEETGITFKSSLFLDDFSFTTSYFNDKGVHLELHHTGLIYQINFIDIKTYDPSIFFEDVKGSFWIDRSQITIKNSSPLLVEALTL